jgi:hypothetical protein
MTNIPIPGTASSLPSYIDVPTDPLTPDQQMCLDLAWLKIEDCFDSMPGGPYLLDITKQKFSPQKSSLLFPYALARINYTIPNPPTPVATSINSFDYQNHHILFSQALVLELIAHLMRSYVEMPVPEGQGNITWLSRMDYKMRWEEIYKLETEQFVNILRVYKRGQLNLGRTKGVLHFKAGRLMPLPMRTRVPRSFGW